MHAERLRGNRVGAGILLTATVLLLGVLSLAYAFFRQSGPAFSVGLTVTAIGVVSGILLVGVMPNRPNDRYSAR